MTCEGSTAMGPSQRSHHSRGKRMKHTKFKTYQLFISSGRYADSYGTTTEAAHSFKFTPVKEFVKARTQKEAESRMTRRLQSRDISILFQVKEMGGDE